MKTKNYSFLVALFTLGANALYAQDKQPTLGLSVQQVSTSKWNTQDGIPYKQAPGINMGAISFAVPNVAEVAYLCNATNEILIANKESGSVTRRFPVLFAPRDFVYDNGLYYVLNADQVAVYDNAGGFIKNIAFPANKYTGVEHITRCNNATYLLLPSGNSLLIESAGMPTAPKESAGWITTNGLSVLTKITGQHTYVVTIITTDGKRYEKSFATEKPTAGVYAVGVAGNHVYLDLQTYITGNPISVERNIVAVEIKGAVVTISDLGVDEKQVVPTGLGDVATSIKVPDCYYVLSNTDFILYPNGILMNMITAPSGMYVFLLKEVKVVDKDPAGYPDYISAVKYHFNDHMLKVDAK